MPNSIPRARSFRWQFHVSSLAVLVALSAIGSCFLSTWSPPPIARDASWPARCPRCGSLRVAKILYGYLDLDQQRIARALDDGVVAVGGCIGGGPGDSKWKCTACSYEWGGVAARTEG
jgi:hypothetical protein